MKTKPLLSVSIRQKKGILHAQAFMYGILVYQTREKADEPLALLERVSKIMRGKFSIIYDRCFQGLKDKSEKETT